MTTLTLDQSRGKAPQWKTLEYHGQQMHVRAERRAHEIAELSGPGHQWDFTVNITAKDGGPTATASASARSDPQLFYSTRAIAEDMGFVKGRELIAGS